MIMTRRRCLTLVLGIVASGSVASARAAETLTILTGEPNGIYFPLGIALGKIMSDGLPDRSTRVQVSKGSVENLRLLAQGKGELAFALADSLKAATQGDAEAGFPQPLPQLRAIGALYPNYIQIVARAKSGIKTLSDLKGKSLSIGSQQSGTDLNARALLEAAGLDDGDIRSLPQLSFADAVAKMIDGKLDATLQSSGLGVASLNRLSDDTDIVVVPVPTELVKKIGPPFTPGIIPASTYRGQSNDVPTAMVMNYLVTRADVPDALAARMAELVYGQLDELVKAHPAARAIKLETAAQTPIALHPGAARYFRDKNLLK
jgi:TRAP transporter TAXI family solute receptor